MTITLTVETLTSDDMLMQTEGQFLSTMRDQLFIYHEPSAQYYGIDEVGELIWTLALQPIAVREIRDALVQAYEVTIEEAEYDVLRFCSELLNVGLLRIASHTV